MELLGLHLQLHAVPSRGKTWARGSKWVATHSALSVAQFRATHFPPSSKGNKYALTAVCMFTGYTFCIPIKNKTAEEVVTA